MNLLIGNASVSAFKALTEINSPKGEPVIIAVYDFADMTGQKKPSDSVASMSTAVTQGSYQLLIKALQDAGNGKWFRVVERTSLPSLLQERKLIRSTRQQVNGEGAEPLPPLLFAGAYVTCLLYTSPSPRDRTRSRMPSSA